MLLSAEFELRSRLLTLGIARASSALLSLNRSLQLQMPSLMQSRESELGNLPVTSYTQVAKLTASFHTEYSLKFGFAHLLVARNSPSELGSPLAPASGLAPAIVKVKVIVKVYNSSWPPAIR